LNDSNQPSAITARVKQCIVEAIDVNLAPSAISDDLPLLSKGLALDSAAILRLIAALESEFDVEIDDEALRPELFQSVGTLSAYLSVRLRPTE
jgi:acyl carrier protein